MQKTVESHRLEVQAIVEKLETCMIGHDIEAALPAVLSLLSTMYMQIEPQNKFKNLKFIQDSVKKIEQIAIVNEDFQKAVDRTPKKS